MSAKLATEEITFRPLVMWPGKRSDFQRSARFKSSYSKTISDLCRELRFLKAKNVVIKIAVAAGDIRRDGLPYADCRPEHSGVILSFDSKHGPLNYPCDSFDTWEDNLRAIALSLENLRAVDRYGVTQRGEQYRGWAELPAPKISAADARRILTEAGNLNGKLTKESLAVAFRAAAIKTHPDTGGDAASFKKVQEAKKSLGSRTINKKGPMRIHRARRGIPIAPTGNNS